MESEQSLRDYVILAWRSVPQLVKKVPKQLHRVMRNETEIEWRLEVPVLANDLLQYKCLVDGAVLWSVPCLSGDFELCYSVL